MEKAATWKRGFTLWIYREFRNGQPPLRAPKSNFDGAMDDEDLVVPGAPASSPIGMTRNAQDLNQPGRDLSLRLDAC